MCSTKNMNREFVLEEAECSLLPMFRFGFICVRIKCSLELYPFILFSFGGCATLPRWLSGSTCQAGDVDSVPGSGRSPGERNGSPLQYSCLENPMNRGAWRATVHVVAEDSDMTEWLNLWDLVPQAGTEPRPPSVRGAECWPLDHQGILRNYFLINCMVTWRQNSKI